MDQHKTKTKTKTSTKVIVGLIAGAGLAAAGFFALSVDNSNLPSWLNTNRPQTEIQQPRFINPQGYTPGYNNGGTQGYNNQGYTQGYGN